MSRSRRVLVAARHLAPDRTSEGLCTRRFLSALAAAGHVVRCVTTETASGDTAGPPGVDVVRLSGHEGRRWRAVDRALDPATGLRGVARSAVTVGSGREPRSWADLADWRAGLRRELARFSPDVVVARGGGLGFEAHLALVAEPPTIPWVAHYHDPYPLSAYPPAYAHRTPILSAQEERANRRILRRATVVTFPSDRLADWTERSSGVSLGPRRAVVPHIGGDAPGATDHALVDDLVGDRSFVLVHTGTLLGPRSPLPLLRAFRRWVMHDGAIDRARLVLLGGIDRRHRRDAELNALRAELEANGTLRVHDQRTTPATAHTLVARSTAAIVIEAADQESPFFPAKLADYVAADVPIVALSPARSVACDLLGAGHPLWSPADDVSRITTVLGSLSSAASAGDLTRLRPREAARRVVSPEHVGTTIDDVLARAVGQVDDRAKDAQSDA